MFYASVPVRISSNFSNVAVGTFSRPSFLPDAKFFMLFLFCSVGTDSDAFGKEGVEKLLSFLQKIYSPPSFC